MHVGLVRHQCYRKFTSLSFFLYTDRYVSIIPNCNRSFQIGCGSPTINRTIFSFCAIPQTLSSLKLPCSCSQISHSAIMRTQGISQADQALKVNYEELLEAQNDDNILIIDVREHDEIKETGKLPGSIHIPMAEVRDTLFKMPEEDFKVRYHKNKPTMSTKIIFSCRSGKRSGIISATIHGLGYRKVYNYTGGWLEWESKQSKKKQEKNE